MFTAAAVRARLFGAYVEGAMDAAERFALRVARAFVAEVDGGATAADRLLELAEGPLPLPFLFGGGAAFFLGLERALVGLGAGGVESGRWIQRRSGPMNQYVLLVASSPIGSRRWMENRTVHE